MGQDEETRPPERFAPADEITSIRSILLSCRKNFPSWWGNKHMSTLKIGTYDERTEFRPGEAPAKPGAFGEVAA
jgi:hypothetical protein